MIRIRRFGSLALTLVVAAAAVVPGAAVQAEAPITLRLASPDPTGRASEEPLQFFVDEVARRSGGAITIDPVFEVSSDDPALPFEQYAADQVSKGEYQLALVASRGWDKSGITTPWALQAPFLIDNDALAVAVASSDAATDVLAGMSGAGVTGLALWPEDLRHPFAFVPFGKAFLNPGDFAGTTIRAIPSHVGYELLSAMGATPIFKDGYGADVIDGLIQGAESGMLQGATLPANPTATGNVTFFPKYEVLVANSDALAQLSEAQRGILASAAVATRDHAIASRTSDVAAGADWCTGSQGRIVLASDDQLAAFRAAAAPIYTELEADPAVKSIIASIQALKTATPASPSAAACEPGPRPTPPTDVDTTAAVTVPDGTYQTVITPQDLIDGGWSTSRVPSGSETWFFIVDGDTWTLHLEGDSPDADCQFPVTMVDNVIRLETRACGYEERSIDFQWKAGPNGAIDLKVVNVDPSWMYSDDAAWFGRTWNRVE